MLSAGSGKKSITFLPDLLDSPPKPDGGCSPLRLAPGSFEVFHSISSISLAAWRTLAGSSIHSNRHGEWGTGAGSRTVIGKFHLAKAELQRNQMGAA